MASTFASLGLIQAGSRAPDQRIFLESEHIIIINNNNDNINNNNNNDNNDDDDAKKCAKIKWRQFWCFLTFCLLLLCSFKVQSLEVFDDNDGLLRVFLVAFKRFFRDTFWRFQKTF